MLALRGDHLSGSFGRPADAGGFAHFGAELAGEILVGIVAGRRDEGLEGGGAGFAQGRVGFALQLFVEALANDGPIAEVIGDGPDQLDAFGAEIGDLRGGGGKKGFGGLVIISGEHHEELAAAAGAQQDAGQAEFGEEGAGQDFAEQSDPLRLAGE